MATILNRLPGFARRASDSESGAELVEFALTFPLLLFVVLGILDFGMMFQQYEVLTNAAREGARIAVLPDYQTNLQGNVNTRVTDYINASFLSGGGSVTIKPVTTANVSIGGNCMTTVTVTVTYPHPYLFLGGIANYFGASSLTSKTLTASSTMRQEATSGTCS
jgi:Flp pilus assembly protein TadG